ncbi:MAG TPA: hypothetical protein DCM26_05505 [Desulfotomaculum sp.]|nr:hypothetical protein [Desulfotomaculum sp.]
MSLFYPQALWLALTIPAILALYILRPRYQQKTVPSILLWQQISVPRQATRPWQRLKPQLLLWLQLLAAALFTLGAAAPVWYLNKPSPGTIVLLDASASMQAVDLGKTRFNAALSEIEAIALGLEKGARLTVIAFDRQPMVVVNESGDYNEIRRALQELKPSPFSAELGPALSLAQTLARGKTRPRLLLLTDGGVAGLDEHLELKLIGSKNAANVAITSLNLRPASAGQAALAMLVNYGGQPASGKVQLIAGGQLQEAKKFHLEPGKSFSLLWPALPSGVPVEAQLYPDDARMDHFLLDNRAWAVPFEIRQGRILLVTKGNLFLEKMLNILPHWEVYKITPEEYPSLLAGGYPYDLTVLDGLAKPLPPGAVFLLNPPPGEITGGLFIGGKTKPAELVPEPGSPFAPYVDLSQVHVAAARSLELRGQWLKDINSRGKVVMAHGNDPGRKIAVLGFALGDSDLPLRPAFPVLMQNVIYWLLPPDMGVPAQVRMGEEVKVNALPRAQKITAESPGDTVATLAPPFPPSPWAPEKPGLYRLTQTIREGETRVSRITRLVAVNGYSDRESDIAVKNIRHPKTKKAQVSSAAHRPLPLTWGLALVALLAVLTEWGVASRGR